MDCIKVANSQRSTSQHNHRQLALTENPAVYNSSHLGQAYFWYDNDKYIQPHFILTELPSLPTIRFDHTSLEVSFGSAVSVSLSLVLLLFLPALSLLDSIVEYSWMF